MVNKTTQWVRSQVYKDKYTRIFISVRLTINYPYPLENLLKAHWAHCDRVTHWDSYVNALLGVSYVISMVIKALVDLYNLENLNVWYHWAERGSFDIIVEELWVDVRLVLGISEYENNYVGIKIKRWPSAFLVFASRARYK